MMEKRNRKISSNKHETKRMQITCVIHANLDSSEKEKFSAIS